MDGTEVARRIDEQTTRDAARVTETIHRRPTLATVLVGDDPASATYVRMKQRRSEQLGLASRAVTLDVDATTADVLAIVRDLDSNPDVDGILVQHPTPKGVDERAVFEAISGPKDVDGVTTASFGAMAFGGLGHHSCTAEGIVRLLDAYDIPIEGQRAVVVGRSPILGMPVGMLLLGRNATVTYCHSRTRDLAGEVARADIVVAAVGKPRLVRGDWIKPGATVIDAGYNPGNVGDVDFETARDRAGFITPVPGGVGPMTIAVLLRQTVDAAMRKAGYGNL
jgi:methylenetetrahydrofolate dehydrogenase (NADP+)/methenyltetrahydrofolate cyclohydrolase